MVMASVLMRVENEAHVFREVGPKIQCPLLPSSSVIRTWLGSGEGAGGQLSILVLPNSSVVNTPLEGHGRPVT